MRTKIIPASEKRTHRGVAQEIRRIKKRTPGASNAIIARAVGCTTGHVSTVLSRFLGKHTEEELAQFQEQKPSILAAMQMRSLESITSKKLDKSSAAQLSTIYGILHDKQALLLGQPTGINLNVLYDVVEAIKAKQQ